MKKAVLTFLTILLCVSGNSMATLISSSSDASLTGATIVDFNSETMGEYTSLSIGDLAITANDSFYIEDTYSGYYNSTGLYLGNRHFGASIITFDFSTTVSAFGFNIGASNEDWRLDAFDPFNAIIESYILPQTWFSNSGDFYGITADGINYATLTQLTDIEDPGKGDYILLDNIHYISSTAPVPEPATTFLLGSGLVGLVCFRRKCKKA